MQEPFSDTQRLGGLSVVRDLKFRLGVVALESEGGKKNDSVVGLERHTLVILDKGVEQETRTALLFFLFGPENGGWCSMPDSRQVLCIEDDGRTPSQVGGRFVGLVGEWNWRDLFRGRGTEEREKPDHAWVVRKRSLWWSPTLNRPGGTCAINARRLQWFTSAKKSSISASHG